MSAPENAALAFVMAQHATEQAQIAQSTVTVVSVTRSPNPVKRAKGKTAQPVEPKPLTTAALGLTLPEKGTLDAAGFMQAVRHAGRRIDQGGLPFTNSQEVRGDLIKAIAGYIGYDSRGDFGTQETNARAMAQRALTNRPNAGPTVREQRAAVRSVTGFVAGLPDNIQRKLADLRGREVTSAETMLTHSKAAKDMNRSAAERELSKGLADLERQRLDAIRLDIQALTF